MAHNNWVAEKIKKQAELYSIRLRQEGERLKPFDVETLATNLVEVQMNYIKELEEEIKRLNELLEHGIKETSYRGSRSTTPEE